MTIEQLLLRARRGLRRLEPVQAQEAVVRGAMLVDIRSDRQRARDGILPGALIIERNAVEWRCAPSSAWRDPKVSDPRRTLIILCDEGYQSSLVAATLQELGLPNATDVIGGFQGWRAAGLPCQPALAADAAGVEPSWEE